MTNIETAVAASALKNRKPIRRLRRLIFYRLAIELRSTSFDWGNQIVNRDGSLAGRLQAAANPYRQSL